MSEYLENYKDFKTPLLFKDGLEWQLCVEFLEVVNGEVVDVAGYLITGKQMLEVHGAIIITTETFGLPLIGDLIHTPNDDCKIVERGFDVKNRIVTLGVEA